MAEAEGGVGAGRIQVSRDFPDKSCGDLLLADGLLEENQGRDGLAVPLTNDRIFKAAEFLGLEAESLLEAAAESRGFYELDASELSQKGRQVGATLMRGWPTYTDKEFEKIARLLQELDAMEGKRRGKT